MNPYPIIGALVAAIACGVGGYFKGRADMDTAWQLQAAEAAENARMREQVLQGKANANIDKLQADRDRVAGQLADAVDRLRQRPGRLPEPARTDCKGATGAELSAEDGGFLVREAARADRIQGALAACYWWADIAASPMIGE